MKILNGGNVQRNEKLVHLIHVIVIIAVSFSLTIRTTFCHDNSTLLTRINATSNNFNILIITVNPWQLFSLF